MSAQRAAQGHAMRLRSLLFVPGDRPERFEKAAASGADAIILDLEDSVVLSRKSMARAAVAEYLAGPRPVPTIVRVCPLDSGMAEYDLAAILTVRPDMIMLPKAEGIESVLRLVALMGEVRVPILPIATETPAALFQLGSYAQVSEYLGGLTWGAEDLPAAIGATSARENDGRYTPSYEMARSLTLFAAHAADIAAIETVFPAITDQAGLAAYAARGRRDGFTGMMAIHPTQVPVINAAFTPSTEEIRAAQAIVDIFEANPGAGAIQLDGKMLDAPHLKAAKRMIAQVECSSD